LYRLPAALVLAVTKPAPASVTPTPGFTVGPDYAGMAASHGDFNRIANARNPRRKLAGLDGPVNDMTRPPTPTPELAVTPHCASAVATGAKLYDFIQPADPRGNVTTALPAAKLAACAIAPAPHIAIRHQGAAVIVSSADLLHGAKRGNPDRYGAAAGPAVTQLPVVTQPPAPRIPKAADRT